MFLKVFVSVANLSKTEKLEEIKSDIDSRMETIAKLAFENERLYSMYQQLSDKYAPRNIQVCFLYILIIISTILY